MNNNIISTLSNRDHRPNGLALIIVYKHYLRII